VKARLVVSSCSGNVPDGLTSDLYEFLTSDAHSSKSPSETVTEAEKWLEMHGVPATGDVPACKSDKHKKRKQKKAHEDTEVTISKKCPMKTADDVVKRILWDQQLKPDDFVVGYVDRFLGVLEEDFVTFSWEDLASVDDHVALAIPKHRIQYFKYRGIVVWDKALRLDNVFGSTGSGKTIMDIVEQLGDAVVVRDGQRSAALNFADHGDKEKGEDLRNHDNSSED